MDEESLIEVIRRWQHHEDETGWLENLYLHHHLPGEYEEEDGDGYYLGRDLQKWESYSRTASSPSLHKCLYEYNE